MIDEAWLDVTLIRCPHCRKLFVDASWYIIDMEADIECSKCGRVFNTYENRLDRVLLRFIIKGGKVSEVKIVERLA